MTDAAKQTFEEAVEEFIALSNLEIGKESQEHFPPPPPAPFPQDGPPVYSALVIDEETIRNYSYSIGDDNPLFVDPAYAEASPYGAQIAPGPILSIVRYPSAHGVDRPEGYPVANYISGNAWEFYDVLRVGSHFNSSKITRESFEKQGAQGRLLFLMAEVLYWDQTRELKAKAYATQIHVPVRTMETGRAMDVGKLGQYMMYNRPATQYTAESAAEIHAQIVNEQRRGAEPRYWEDVEVGEELPSIVLPPFTVQDMVAYHRVQYGITATNNRGRHRRAFRPAYLRGKNRPDFVRTNPVTRWPYTPGDEHEDVILAVYRGQPGPFDFGVQRTQIPERLLTNWMGDAGFLRKMYTAFRRPVYYGDTTWYRGKVEKKYVVTETGAAEPGGVPGSAEYYAVGISIEGTNQVGEQQCPGFATVYLPSRKGGPVQLPIPHPAQPDYVPFETHRRLGWF